MASLDIQTGPEPGTTFALGLRSLMIGRNQSCTIEIPAEQVSRRHLRIVHDRIPGRRFAIEAGSANDVFLDGGRIDRGTERVLVDGDEIRVGQSAPRHDENGGVR